VFCQESATTRLLTAGQVVAAGCAKSQSGPHPEYLPDHWITGVFALRSIYLSPKQNGRRCRRVSSPISESSGVIPVAHLYCSPWHKCQNNSIGFPPSHFLLPPRPGNPCCSIDQRLHVSCSCRESMTPRMGNGSLT